MAQMMFFILRSAQLLHFKAVCVCVCVFDVSRDAKRV